MKLVINSFIQLFFSVSLLLFGAIAITSVGVGAQQENCQPLAENLPAYDACLARNAAANESSACNLGQSFLGLPTWYKYLDTETDPTGRCSPVIAETSDALPIGIAVLEGTIRLAGVVAVVMIFISAFKFITAQDNPDSAAAARKTAINALIGLVIVIVSTGVVSYIGNTIGS